VALQLKKAGVNKVHPLEGGFEAWLKLGLPTEPVSPAEAVPGPHLDDAHSLEKA
jgi:3-mercaptopyruvate sulfurtransferase SseA